METIKGFLLRNRLLVAAVVMSALALGMMTYQNGKLERSLERLGAAYDANEAKLREADAEVVRWKEKYGEQLAQLADLQRQNDAKAKEAGRNAYEKTAALSGDLLLDHFRLWIDDARGRNEERRRNF